MVQVSSAERDSDRSDRQHCNLEGKGAPGCGVNSHDAGVGIFQQSGSCQRAPRYDCIATRTLPLIRSQKLNPALKSLLRVSRRVIDWLVVSKSLVG